MSDDEEEERRRRNPEAPQPPNPVLGALRHIYRDHLTKVIGYVAAAAGAVAVMDPALVARTLGPDATEWALLITGFAALVRGHQNSRAQQPK